MHYYLYFAGYDGKTEQIGLAYSTDQVHWQISPQPIIPVGETEAWDSFQTSNPSVLQEEGRFRMWYQGVDEQRRYRIGYAESPDGWRWQKHPTFLLGHPLDPTSKPPYPREGCHQPHVIREPAGYRMYFLDHRQGLGYIRVAFSKDGLAWEVHPEDCLRPEKTWEDHGLHYPWVIHNGNHYVMWYTSQAAKTRWFLNRAVSQDGIVWQRDPAHRPLIDLPQVRRVSLAHRWIPRKLLRLYPFYYHPRMRQLGTKTIHGGWLTALLLKIHDGVVFPLRQKRYLSFNNSSVHKLSDGSYLMYFQALTEGLTYAIGIAASPDGCEWQPLHMDILRQEIAQKKIDWCSVFDADPHLLLVE